jgi:HAD superfamily hydrolase (TIGR01509 family)
LIRAVLFDFNDTLFWRAGDERVALVLASVGVAVEPGRLRALWHDVKRASGSTEELARQRDASAEAHRRCWLELLRPFDELHPDLAEMLYEDQPNPEGWRPFPEAVEVLRTLSELGIPIGVVSDIGWDLRPIFARHGVSEVIDAWVLSFEHGTEKPDPRLFHHGCELLGVGPAETLMVGDSVARDGGAAAAGLASLVLPAYSGCGERGLRHALRLVTD